MSDSALNAPSIPSTLRKLFLTLFLRGRSSQGLNLKTTPKNIGQSLGLVLVLYTLVGLTALFFLRSEVFVLSAYMHAFSFMAIGMYLVSGAGDALFNKEEADILLHRPISGQALLWAKVTVLVQVSLTISLALNLVGLFAGIAVEGSSWLFPFVHLVSMTEEALFSAGFVVLVYQLCLRWFGRQRLESLMTSMQVLVMVGFMLGSQVLPRVLVGNMMESGGRIDRPWWLALIPPGWFAGLDDAIVGGHSTFSWLMAGLGLVATSAVCWLAFGKLAKSFQEDMGALNEAVAPSRSHVRQLRLLSWIARESPVRWLLRDSVSRAGFVLTAAYIWRDREIKLRVYPALTSVLMMPIVMMFANPSHTLRPHVQGAPNLAPMFETIFGTMAMAFAGGFLSSSPLTALNLLSFSQQWRASEVFLQAPVRGPWAIQHGAMIAVDVVVALPMLIVLIGFGIFMHAAFALPLLLPGILLIPVYGRLPALLQGAVPLSRATEEARAASRGCLVMLAPFFGLAVSGIGVGFNYLGWLYPMLFVELCLVVGFCYAMKARLEGATWRLEG